MTPRSVIVLAAAAAVALAGAGWQLQSNSSGYVETQRGERLLPELLARANDVASITVSQGEERSVLNVPVRPTCSADRLIR